MFPPRIINYFYLPKELYELTSPSFAKTSTNNLNKSFKRTPKQKHSSAGICSRTESITSNTTQNHFSLGIHHCLPAPFRALQISQEAAEA